MKFIEIVLQSGRGDGGETESMNLIWTINACMEISQ
jgi:hypothetical protein